jgi:MerR family transcriptional regulator, light-induced transcriptional regulator
MIDAAASETSLPLSAFSEKPSYNVKAVCVRTGISAATLRAWERRYGLPAPNRTQQGYRLYSDRDIAVLFWLLQQTSLGMSIGQAAQQFNAMMTSGHDPEVRVPANNALLKPEAPRSPSVIREELVAALIDMDGRAADTLMTEAAAMYTLETTLIAILREAVMQIRQMRRDGDVTAAIEHFGVNHLRQRLINMVQTTPTDKTRRHVMTIGFTDERNEFDLLIMALVLRRQGWHVVNLGMDLDPTLLRSSIAGTNTALVVFYADKPENAAKLIGLPRLVDQRGAPVRVVVAGKALEMLPDLRSKFDYLGNDLRHSIREIMNIMRQIQNPYRQI